MFYRRADDGLIVAISLCLVLCSFFFFLWVMFCIFNVNLRYPVSGSDRFCPILPLAFLCFFLLHCFARRRILEEEESVCSMKALSFGTWNDRCSKNREGVGVRTLFEKNCPPFFCSLSPEVGHVNLIILCF